MNTLPARLLLLAVCVVGLVTWNWQRSLSMEGEGTLSMSQRLLLQGGNSSNGTASSFSGTCTGNYSYCCEATGYPYDYVPVGKGALTCDALESGGVILLAFGLMYMFVALAIICDEFFIPALEVSARLFAEER